jgi:hypothetical protein
VGGTERGWLVAWLIGCMFNVDDPGNNQIMATSSLKMVRQSSAGPVVSTSKTFHRRSHDIKFQVRMFEFAMRCVRKRSSSDSHLTQI